MRREVFVSDILFSIFIALLAIILLTKVVRIILTIIEK